MGGLMISPSIWGRLHIRATLCGKITEASKRSFSLITMSGPAFSCFPRETVSRGISAPKNGCRGENGTLVSQAESRGLQVYACGVIWQSA